MTRSNPTDVDKRITGDVPITDAETAADSIPADATILTSGFGSVGYPKAVPLALANSPRDLNLTLVHSGNVGAEIDVDLVEAGAIERRFSYQTSRAAKTATNNREIAFSDRNVYSIGDEVQYGGLVTPEIAIVEAIAVGEDWFIPSTSLGQTPAFVEAADELIVELNRYQPLELQQIHDIYRPEGPPHRDPIPLSEPGEKIGTPRVSFAPETLHSVIETDRRDSPYVFREPTAEDNAIAANLQTFLRDELDRSPVFDERVTLQFGFGSLGNALMRELKDMDYDGREVVYYGELIMDGLFDMLDENVLTAASATSLALSEDGQDRLFSNISRYADDIILRPADISNRPAIIDRFGIIAVNSALEVDLYGHVNSTHINGSRMMNGVGGSADFNRNAILTVCALPAMVKGKDISRIVPLTFHVDHTEHDIDVIVTDQGVADLRGLSPVERAEAIIDECAHPAVTDDLRGYLDASKKTSHHIPHDLSTAIDWRS